MKQGWSAHDEAAHICGIPSLSTWACLRFHIGAKRSSHRQPYTAPFDREVEGEGERRRESPGERARVVVECFFWRSVGYGLCDNIWLSIMTVMVKLVVVHGEGTSNRSEIVSDCSSDWKDNIFAILLSSWNSIMSYLFWDFVFRLVLRSGQLTLHSLSA